MTPEPRTDADERPVNDRAELPVESPPATPPALPADIIEARREGPSPATSTQTPPQDRIAVGIQRMPFRWRWALGLGLAFLSGLAAFAALFGLFPAVNVVGLVVTLIVTLVLALAAGFALSSWTAALALVIAAAAGGLVGSWVSVLAYPAESIEGFTGFSAALVLFFWFAFFCLAPLIVILLAGVGIGRWRGISLEQPHARAAGEPRVS